MKISFWLIKKNKDLHRPLVHMQNYVIQNKQIKRLEWDVITQWTATTEWHLSNSTQHIQAVNTVQCAVLLFYSFSVRFNWVYTVVCTACLDVLSVHNLIATRWTTQTTVSSHSTHIQHGRWSRVMCINWIRCFVHWNCRFEVWIDFSGVLIRRKSWNHLVFTLGAPLNAKKGCRPMDLIIISRKIVIKTADCYRFALENVKNQWKHDFNPFSILNSWFFFLILLP